MQKITIIGAGFAGLSVAALLAKEGYKVKILEKNSLPGGRARKYEKAGFTFDMGPSWYLMPDVFEDFFSVFDKKPEDYLELKRLDPFYRIFFGGEDVVDIRSDLEKNIKLFDSFEKNGGEKLQRYLDEASVKYQVSMDHFIHKDYSSIRDFFNKNLMVNGPKLTVFNSLDSYVSSIFSSDKAKKILEYSVVFLGGNPKNTPALYSLMSHVDFNLGVWYPVGGIWSVVEALVGLCESLGVEIILNEEVTKIEVRDKVANKVVTSTGEYESDIVISGADYVHSETELLDLQNQTYKKKYWDKKIIAPSAFIMYLGLNKRVNNLQHHNLFLANDWMKHFDSIFEDPSWPEDPSYYVSCPSVTDRSVVPENGELVFVLIPVASDLEDTPEIRKKYRDWVIKDLEKSIGENIEENIVVERTYAHKDFSQDYNSFKGTGLGLAHTLMQSAIFRPKNKSKKVKNLYYTGQYTNPGIGVPMALISSQIVSSLIKKEYASTN